MTDRETHITRWLLGILAGILVALLGFFGRGLAMDVRDNVLTDVKQGERLMRLETQWDQMSRSLGTIENKIDQILTENRRARQ